MANAETRVLVYKRTHNGDPDERGCFGVYDCMGTVRDREYGAVIGVGGAGHEPEVDGIAGKIDWIGIGPRKVDVEGKRGPEVTFDHFVYYGNHGPFLEKVAPVLAERMYSENVRQVMDAISRAERREVEAVLAWAENAPALPCRSGSKRAGSAAPVSLRRSCSVTAVRQSKSGR